MATTFIAKDRCENEYVIVVFERKKFRMGIRRVTTYDDGTKRLLTDDGRKVRRISKGKYEIVGTPNIPIESTDPIAP